MRKLTLTRRHLASLLGLAGMTLPARALAGWLDRVSGKAAPITMFAVSGNAPPVDHTPWQRLLDAYLDARHASGVWRFDYARVTAADAAALDAYLAVMAALDPRTLPRAEQMAYWINLYNALTVHVVLKHPDADSIRDMGDSIFAGGPWQAARITVAGKALSLDAIEHGILRPLHADRRIHFAVNCASIGCPNLAPTVFTGANLEAQLANAEREYIAHPRGLRVDGDRVVLSSIFDWYAEDFAVDEAGLVDYLAGVAPADTAAQLRARKLAVQYAYDWALNRP